MSVIILLSDTAENFVKPREKLMWLVNAYEEPCCYYVRASMKVVSLRLSQFLTSKRIICMVIHQNICLENALSNYQSIFQMFPRAEHFITDSSRTCTQRTSRDPVPFLRYACFSFNNKQHNFQTNIPSWNNSCLMEQDRKQFPHSSWNIEKRKRNQRKLSPCWRIQLELDRKQ